jgi:Gtp-binding protein of the ras superfamily involved in termination of M-phase
MSAFDDDSKEIPIKIGIVGDTETGKTSLMIKYVENKFDEDYIMTIGN